MDRWSGEEAAIKLDVTYCKMKLDHVMRKLKIGGIEDDKGWKSQYL